MRKSSLLALLCALVLAAEGLGAFHVYAVNQARRYVHVLAAPTVGVKLQGSLLQRVAFQETDLLPLYGSSELRDTDLFSSYATGFNAFQVGRGGMSPLNFAQQLAGVGAGARGKAVALSITPGEFLFAYGISDDNYAGNFSRAHAYALAFSPDLSLGLRRDIARRMLEFPATLKSDPFLRFALERLADDTPVSGLTYDLVYPLGRLQVQIQDLQDDYEVLQYLRTHPNLDPNVKRTPATLNWPALVQDAEVSYRRHSNNNLFSLDNSYWKQNWASLLVLRNSTTDEKFMREMQRSKSWQDFELMLRVAQELGTRTLVIGAPLNGSFFEFTGVSAQARANFYNRLTALGTSYHATVTNFRDRDEDRSFSEDRWSHPSEKGWVYYEQVLDAFYHLRQLDVACRSNCGGR